MVTSKEQGSANVMRKAVRLLTSLLSTVLRRPAAYPKNRPTKIGTRELARTWIILDSILFQPLRFEFGTNKNGGFSHFARARGFESIVKIGGATAGICDGCDQFGLYVTNLLLRRVFWI